MHPGPSRPSLLPECYGAGLPLVHYRQAVGDILVEAAAGYLEVHDVFARWQGRQRRPEPRRYQLIRTGVEQAPLGYLGGEEPGVCADQTLSIDRPPIYGDLDVRPGQLRVQCLIGLLEQ